MTHPSPRASASHLPRHDGMESGHRMDPYRDTGKLQEPTTCPDCHASVHGGRWTWQTPVAGAEEHRCPACQRIHDRVPAGEIRLDGSFLAEHEDEILRLVNHTEARIKAEHPLERLIAMEKEPDRGEVVVTFTGTHVTHGVGEALRSAFGGLEDTTYPEGGSLLRIHWSR
jgi:hypothetical protein